MKTTATPPPRNWQKLKLHPLCARFPVMNEHESGDLQDSMTHGYSNAHPIILCEHEGEMKVLDGRNRLQNAVLAKVTPTFAKFVGTHDEQVNFVIAVNIARRNISRDSALQILMDLKPVRGVGRPPENNVAKVATISREDAALMVRGSQRTIDRNIAARSLPRETIDKIIRCETSTFRALADAKKEAAPKPKKPCPPRPVHTDTEGHTIHPRAKEALTKGREQFSEAIRHLRAVKKAVLALAGNEFGRAIHTQTVEIEINNVINHLKGTMPTSSCPLNDPCTKSCLLCHGTQWITEAAYNGMDSKLKGKKK